MVPDRLGFIVMDINDNENTNMLVATTVVHALLQGVSHVSFSKPLQAASAHSSEPSSKVNSRRGKTSETSDLCVAVTGIEITQPVTRHVDAAAIRIDSACFFKDDAWHARLPLV